MEHELENGTLGKFVTDFPTPELVKRSTDKNDVGPKRLLLKSLEPKTILLHCG